METNDTLDTIPSIELAKISGGEYTRGSFYAGGAGWNAPTGSPRRCKWLPDGIAANDDWAQQSLAIAARAPVGSNDRMGNALIAADALSNANELRLEKAQHCP